MTLLFIGKSSDFLFTVSQVSQLSRASPVKVYGRKCQQRGADMRKKLLLSSAMFIAAISSASAADLPVKAPMMAPAPIFSWTGFYVGLNLGGKWADVDHTVTNGATTFNFSRDTA